jgi:Xaa-Pro aminopeptidase
MIDLKLLAGSVAGIIESGAYKPFYPHQTGHWLGLDVHDAGEYMSNDIWVKLKPGMTLTVEPGLYIKTGRNIPENLHNIGVRLEDNVVITKDGVDIYTTAPREINDIEAMMIPG